MRVGSAILFISLFLPQIALSLSPLAASIKTDAVDANRDSLSRISHTVASNEGPAIASAVNRALGPAEATQPAAPPAVRTTRFTERPPPPIEPVESVRRVARTTRRRLEAAARGVMDRVLPEERRDRTDYVYLRSLEDPVFMSAGEVRAMGERRGELGGPVEVERRAAVPVAGEEHKVRGMLNELEEEMGRRSVRERRRIADEIRAIAGRVALADDSTDTHQHAAS